ncbi:hypothetical protein BCV69DRAFT_204064 [Microstroma glucosiphilum]|uniref:RGS domain-containing protein n=1 Tax=Pseudomicrostroma glucosiphilum TaxID=1684307 RepID=A0A316U7B7_9BASI|nr:hypothetical protein BCV69DRAFT_204064 [Pseudomicrostroma glucosiphilum]PWN20243.1 hypothetical protein BCV69DRAFT_204064 [Pseudomicrostroma glucosiphilum]
MATPIAPWADTEARAEADEPADGLGLGVGSSSMASREENKSSIPSYLQAGSAPEPLQPCSAEGDCSGMAYTIDGKLLIGGLAVDGSATGESGWANVGDVIKPVAPSSAGKERVQALPSPLPTQRGASSNFNHCHPAEGPATFGEKRAEDGSGERGGLGESANGRASWLSTLTGKRRQHGQGVGSSAITLADIVGGRTCRPIALSDLRIYLAKQRDIEDANELLAPAIDTTSFQLSELPQQGNLSTASTENLRVQASPVEDYAREKVAISFVEPTAHLQSQASGEYSAVEFVVAFDRYARQYRSLTAQQKQAMAGPATSANQAMRERFDRLVQRHVGPLPGSTVSRSRSSSAATKSDKGKTITTGLMPISPRPRPTCRLQWMIDLGLLDEGVVSLALSEAGLTTDPEVLLPVVNCIVSHVDTYVLPSFLEAASRNLGKGTSNGRLYSGISLTALAILFTVLLCIEPSPLTGTNISRWYRLLTFPLWAFGIGFIFAAYTGVCMWLSLRGNRDVTGEEKGLSTPSEIESEEGSAPAMATDNRQWLLAPEVWRMLEYVGLKKVLDKIGNGRPSTPEFGSQVQRTSSRLSQQQDTVTVAEGEGSSANGQAKSQRKPLTPVEEKTEQPLASSAAAAAASKKGTASPRAEPAMQSPSLMGIPSAQSKSVSPRLMTKTISIVPGLEVGVRTLVGPGGEALAPPASPTHRPSSSLSVSAAAASMIGRARAHSNAASLASSRAVSIAGLEEGQQGGLSSAGGHRSSVEQGEGSASTNVIGQVSFLPPATPPSSAPARRRRSVWGRAVDGAQTLVGMSVNTERVRDERIRKIHLWRAAKALAIDGALSAVVMIIIVVIP